MKIKQKGFLTYWDIPGLRGISRSEGGLFMILK